MLIIHSGWNFIGAVDNDLYSWVPDNIARPNAGILERIAAFLTNNSVIFAKLRAKFPRYLDVFDLDPERAATMERQFAQLAQRHKSYLKKIIILSRQNGITPILVKYPQIYNPDLRNAEMLKGPFPELFKHRDYFNRQYILVTKMIEEAAGEEGALLIDCARHFDSLPYEEKIGFFKDQMHLKGEGFEIEARDIRDALIKTIEHRPDAVSPP
jgi:hypothetical protein